jgi:glycine cleavage system H protein
MDVKNMYPEELRYTKEHEWLSLESDVGTIGITHHAQSELGDIVFVELPEVGSTVEAGGEFGTVESVKAVSEIYSPVTGEVVEVNGALRDAPELLNQDPYGDGWIAKVRLSRTAELEELIDAGAYRTYVEGAGGA